MIECPRCGGHFGLCKCSLSKSWREDDPPMVVPSPEPSDSTRKTDPAPVSEPAAAAEVTLADVLKAVRASDERQANWLNGFRAVIRDELDATEAKQRAELEQAFGTLSGAIGASERRIIDTMKRELASLDRSLDEKITKVRGAMGELAKTVSDHKHVIDAHLTISAEMRDLAVELAEEKAADDGEERLTLVAEAGQ